TNAGFQVLTGNTKRSFLGSYRFVYSVTSTKARKLELEELRIELEKEKAKRHQLDERRQDIEAEKLELEKVKETRRQEMDERRLNLEEKILESETQREVMQLIKAGMGTGMSFEQIQELTKFTKSFKG
ncbi:hypothetical protein BGZ97_008224, partial [Linnemannia gamsii]